MKITTIEQLKQRIGKFVVLSKVDPNCNDSKAYIKKITKITDNTFSYDCMDIKNEIYKCKIYGTCTAHKMPPFSSTVQYNNGETYVTRIQYARDPTEMELKIFLNMWRIHEYKENKRIFPI
jgi:hypothetical protein